jgi:hypothetical protein
MRKKHLIEQRNLYKSRITQQKYKNYRLLLTGVDTSYVNASLFDGILIENSRISLSTVIKTVAKNAVIGPLTSIEGVYIDDLRLKNSHAIIASELKNSIFHKCLFENGLYRKTSIENSVFVDTVFHSCEFEATAFKKCTFSGCIFYKCRFSDKNLHTQGIHFLKCDFKPKTRLGRYASMASWYPDVENSEGTPSYFVNTEVKDIFSFCENVDRNLMVRYSLPAEVTLKGIKGNRKKALAYANKVWWTKHKYENEGKKEPKQKAKYRAYRFTTSGIK